MSLLALGLGACAAPGADRPVSPLAARDISVFDPEMVIQDDWLHLPMKGLTDYRIVYVAGRLAFRAEPKDSASGLIRRVTIDPSRCPILEWSWRVERLQSTADLRQREAEDVAASVFLLFGDPGFLSDPDPVPTLRYVWTNGRIAEGAVIDNPYLPGVVQSLVLQSGTGRLHTWVTERRDIAADYRRAFGRAPAEPVNAVAIFTDNDQTGDPALAHYGAARAICPGL